MGDGENNPHRARFLVGLSLTATGVGMVGGIVMPDAGCIIPDYCIRIENYGQNNCNYLEDAMMWPAGQPELAEPIPGSHNASGPAGCVCLNSAEQEIVDFEVPAGQYATLMAKIETATRNECDAIVPAGWDHNCYIAQGVGASTVALTHPFQAGPGDCIGTCLFSDPPPGKTCPELNPYECNEDDGETGGESSATGSDSETGGESETGGFPPGNGLLGAGDYVYCVGNSCDVDLSFVQMLYENVEMLSGEGTTLVFNSSMDRFVFHGVTRGSLAFELGLSSGDVLEAVNGTTIEDLDAALQVAADGRDASEIYVRVKRGRQWIDFTYTLVP